MISFNLTKWMDFGFVIATGFFLAAVGHFLFEFDLQFGFFVGIILASWHTLYDNITGIYYLLRALYDEDEDEMPPKEGIILEEVDELK